MISITTQIENKINNSFNHGKIFFTNDFLDITSYETARKTLNRMVDDNKIQRVMKGFYYKPQYSKLLDEYESFSMHELAIAIARKYNWDIAPYGETALNILGLSTQVTSNWKYISSGRYKTYEIDKRILEFKKVKPGEITNMSLMTATVIQAIKALGKENISNEVISKIKTELLTAEKEDLLKESISSAAWIYEVIKKICEVDCE